MGKEVLYPHKTSPQKGRNLVSKELELEVILESLVNGQRESMVKQIKRYGLYDFWADFAHYLESTQSAEKGFRYFIDATVSYFRITNR